MMQFLTSGLALKQGYGQDQERASTLLAYLEENGHIANIFPNCILADWTRSYVETNDSEIEARLIAMITDMYVGSPEDTRLGIGISISAGDDGFVTVESISEEKNSNLLRPPVDLENGLSSMIARDATIYERMFNSIPSDFTFRERFFAFTGAVHGCDSSYMLRRSAEARRCSV